MAGRGTDIELSDAAPAARGLHVILPAFHETSRTDRQLEGRAGRQGDPGSRQAITAPAAEPSTIFTPRAPHLAQSLAEAAPVGVRARAIPRPLPQGAADG